VTNASRNDVIATRNNINRVKRRWPDATCEQVYADVWLVQWGAGSVVKAATRARAWQLAAAYAAAN
jgi:hypothetical protein